MNDAPSIMPEHCPSIEAEHMHGRTDVRTYEEPHSPNLDISLVSDAHAHIRRMDVDKLPGSLSSARSVNGNGQTR